MRRLSLVTEADFRALVKAEMAQHGWVCLLDLSSKRRMPAGLTGAPDLLFVTPGLVLVWLEAKAPGKKRRPAQMEWASKVQPYLCYHHRYVCTDSLAEWLMAVSDLL